MIQLNYLLKKNSIGEGFAQMKDKIFLIWSGSNDVAFKIKRILEDEYNYICYIGGNNENNSQMVSIGDTIIRQMKTCNQAIVLFQNKEDGAISNNLFFELGYVSAKYGMKKVHCVKRNNENIVLPSDFDNSFVESLDAPNNEEFAKNIVNYFIGRQKLSVDINKMYLINNRYIIHEMIQVHYSEVGSKCSDYELAQYILFYMQAAVMFQDEKKTLDELQDFKRNHSNEFSYELNIAVNLSIALLEVEVGLISENDIVYLSDTTFRSYFNMCKDMLDEIIDDDSGTFDEWAKVFASENLAYACSLYAVNPNLNDDMRKYLYERTVDYGLQCIENIKKLESITPSVENNDSIGLISLFKAYVCRHLFTAYKGINPNKAGKWLNASLKERRSLLRNFSRNSIDTKLYANIEMEYYLNLIEYIDFVGKDQIDKFEYMIYLSDIDTFISNYASKNNVHAYIQKIENHRKKI